MNTYEYETQLQTNKNKEQGNTDVPLHFGLQTHSF